MNYGEDLKKTQKFIKRTVDERLKARREIVKGMPRIGINCCNNDCLNAIFVLS